MPAKALGPLVGALPLAPNDLRMNQRLAALHTRAGRFAEAALCCRTLQRVYSEADYPEEATRYGELAERYEERSSTPAPGAADRRCAHFPRRFRPKVHAPNSGTSPSSQSKKRPRKRLSAIEEDEQPHAAAPGARRFPWPTAAVRRRNAEISVEPATEPEFAVVDASSSRRTNRLQPPPKSISPRSGMTPLPSRPILRAAKKQPKSKPSQRPPAESWRFRSQQSRRDHRRDSLLSRSWHARAGHGGSGQAPDPDQRSGQDRRTSRRSRSRHSAPPTKKFGRS